MKTYFEILGVSQDADTATLKRAWRDRVRVTHPDHGGREADFMAVQSAWEALRDPLDRSRYLRSLTEPAPQPKPQPRPQPGTPFTAHTAADEASPASATGCDQVPPARLRDTPAGRAAFSLLVSLAGAVVAVSMIAASVAASAGQAAPQFSIFSWWVGSAVAAALCAQLAARASSLTTPAILFLAFGMELAAPYASFTVAFACMLLALALVAAALFLLPRVRPALARLSSLS